MNLTELELRVWNQGERLIPGRTHNADEIRRHKSSYEFFRHIIINDIIKSGAKNTSILDLGFGCGFGCSILASVQGVHVTGIDIGEECMEYAAANYSRPNIEYMLADITTFLRDTGSFDYVVSRGVLEHIENGLDVVVDAKWTKRLMFDVPYAEPPGNNGHHLLTNITEKDFARWPEVEIFYEDIAGGIYSQGQKPPKPNMIMGTFSRHGMRKARDMTAFPIAPVIL